MTKQSDQTNASSTVLLAGLWLSMADSIMRQLDFVNNYPDAPMREVRTLRKCAAQLEAASKQNGIQAVLHMENAAIDCSAIENIPTCAKCECSVAVRDGEEWEQGIDVCDHCVQEQAYVSNNSVKVINEKSEE